MFNIRICLLKVFQPISCRWNSCCQLTSLYVLSLLLSLYFKAALWIFVNCNSVRLFLAASSTFWLRVSCLNLLYPQVRSKWSLLPHPILQKRFSCTTKLTRTLPTRWWPSSAACAGTRRPASTTACTPARAARCLFGAFLLLLSIRQLYFIPAVLEVPCRIWIHTTPQKVVNTQLQKLDTLSYLKFRLCYSDWLEFLCPVYTFLGDYWKFWWH